MSDDLSWASAPLARIKAADEPQSQSSLIGQVQVRVKPLASGQEPPCNPHEDPLKAQAIQLSLQIIRTCMVRSRIDLKLGGYFEQIPVVNLSQTEAEAATALQYACERYGFFYGRLAIRPAQAVPHHCTSRICAANSTQLCGKTLQTSKSAHNHEACNAVQWLIMA